MTNRALILYASGTGNTSKLANAFQRVLEDYHWDAVSVRLEQDTDLRSKEVFLDDYQLVLLGSPVISSGAAPIISRKLALVDIEPPRLYRNELMFPGSFFRPENAPLGVCFVTYSGETYGPCEAEPALSAMEIYLKYLFIPTIGRFACPGRKESKGTIDLIATELGLSPSETADLMGRYEIAPDDPSFSALSEDALILLQQAVTDKHSGVPALTPTEFGDEVWHKNLDQRPGQRDIKKAEIFLSEILEDYFFEDGTPRPAGSVYTCIG